MEEIRMAAQEIRHEVRIKASPVALYEALTDASKLAQWWIPDTRGRSEPGRALEFWFGGHCQEMRVTALRSNQLVRWQATERGLPDWVGSEIEFAISPKDDRAVVQFRHANWPGNAHGLPYCSMSWAVFLLSLKELLEKGKGFPFPNQWIRQ
jgi:uncharacterized protein YndB with AHSA1/START domain